mmetsp:Transcript_16435/g.46337  ORF Transcript_16435/g.46337 Transcript_16435/m.46337 type:complete len:230 (-) Transcript_16435:521-1210(-)
MVARLQCLLQRAHQDRNAGAPAQALASRLLVAKHVQHLCRLVPDGLLVVLQERHKRRDPTQVQDHTAVLGIVAGEAHERIRRQGLHLLVRGGEQADQLWERLRLHGLPAHGGVPLAQLLKRAEGVLLGGRRVAAQHHDDGRDAAGVHNGAAAKAREGEVVQGARRVLTQVLQGRRQQRDKSINAAHRQDGGGHLLAAARQVPESTNRGDLHHDRAGAQEGHDLHESAAV